MSGIECLFWVATSVGLYVVVIAWTSDHVVVYKKLGHKVLGSVIAL